MLLLQIKTTACDGSDLFWPWIWWLFGAFLLGYLLRWILNKLFPKKFDTSDYDARIKTLESQLDACRKEKSALAAGAATAASFVAASQVDDSVKDDLTKVEGIGPKIKELLNNDGIWSFKQLSESSLERIQKILDDAGPRFRVHNPKTWAQQAKLAAEGKWAELQKWQDELKGGL